MSDNERSLHELADELQKKAEDMKEANRGWTGDEKWFHQRKGQARGFEQSAGMIREIAQSISDP